MSQVRHKSKRRNSDEYCLLCGGCDHPTDPLQWIQVGGGRVDWAHGHCHAKVDIGFAQESMEEAVELLNRAKFDAPGAVKCLSFAIGNLRAAKDCLTGKSLWPKIDGSRQVRRTYDQIMATMAERGQFYEDA